MTIVTPPRVETPSRFPAARRFSLLDLMILVAASAAGLAATRALMIHDDWESLLRQLGPSRVVATPPGTARTEWTAEAVHLNAAILATLSTPTAAALTLGILACGLRGPRPGRRRMMRRPGLVAGLAIVPTLVAWGAFALVAWLGRGGFSGEVPMIGATAMGASVAAAWTLLIAGRGWRPEPTWADRLGRVFGLYWIISGLLLLGYGAIWGL